ncbi:MAG: hypothetical protein ABIG84_07615 [archaeon]
MSTTLALAYPDFKYIIVIGLLIAAIILAAANMMRYKKKKAIVSGSTKTYTCGENIDPDTLTISPDTFYKTFIKAFQLNSLKKLHSGSLTEYLHWMFATLVIILTAMVLLWY